MITAHRTHRHFNIDKYLDEHKTSGPSRHLVMSEGNRTMHVSGLTSEQQRSVRSYVAPQSRFRDWAIRLNGRIERWMESIDFVRVDVWIGTVGGIAITGAFLYFAYVLVDALVRGRFNLGAN